VYIALYRKFILKLRSVTPEVLIAAAGLLIIIVPLVFNLPIAVDASFMFSLITVLLSSFNIFGSISTRV